MGHPALVAGIESKARSRKAKLAQEAGVQRSTEHQYVTLSVAKLTLKIPWFIVKLELALVRRISIPALSLTQQATAGCC
jgi:hypothetical protein